MRLRRLTDDGLQRLREILDEARAGQVVDFELLRDHPGLTEVVEPKVEVRSRSFASRRDAAEYLSRALEPLTAAGVEVNRDAGLWAWLAVAWADHIAPADGAGLRRVRDTARWIPQFGNWKQFYRHLLAGPYWLYQAHRDDPDVANAVLATPIEAPGDVVEQFASRQEMAASPNVLRAVTALYYDERTKRLKRGAATKGPGSSRRLVDIFNQLDLTWDIYGMDIDDILGKLPAEFDRFKSA